MAIENHPKPTSQTERPNERQALLFAALDNVAETLFASEVIAERIRGYEGDRYLQMSLNIHKQALVRQFAEMVEQAVEIFFVHIDGLQANSGSPLYPPLSQAEGKRQIKAINRYKPFTVASICREDLRGTLTKQEIGQLSDSDMESIADRMSDAYRDSGGYWESLEIMARYVLDRINLEDAIEDNVSPQ